VVGLVIPPGIRSTSMELACISRLSWCFSRRRRIRRWISRHQLIVLAVLLPGVQGCCRRGGGRLCSFGGYLGSAGDSARRGVIALVLGIHRLMAEALTFVNLVGNTSRLSSCRAGKVR